VKSGLKCGGCNYKTNGKHEEIYTYTYGGDIKANKCSCQTEKAKYLNAQECDINIDYLIEGNDIKVDLTVRMYVAIDLTGFKSNNITLPYFYIPEDGGYNEYKQDGSTIKPIYEINGNYITYNFKSKINPNREKTKTIVMGLGTPNERDEQFVGAFWIYVPPETMPPVIKDIKQDDVGSISIAGDKWSTGKKITISGTENYCKSVSLNMEDNAGTKYLDNVTVAVNEYNEWSYTFTPNIEVDAKGRTLIVTASDTVGNTTSEGVEKYIEKVDKKAPEPISSNSTSKNWTKTKEMTFLAKDEGSGNVEIAFNDENSYKETTKDGTNYSKSYTFKGDVYGELKVAVYYKDQLGNASKQQVSIYNIDNTPPKINTEINATDIKTNGFKMKVGVEDKGAGIGKIEWYYKKATEKDYESTTIEYTTINGEKRGETKAVEKEYELKYLQSRTIYTIYAKIYDVAGNVTTTAVKKVRTPQEVKITVNLKDSPAGLASVEGICYLSESKDEITQGANQYSFISGEPFTVGDDLHGRYYIWITNKESKGISDRVGNTTDVQCKGELLLDNAPPTITLSRPHSEVCKDIVITITIEDEFSELKSNKGKCYLSTSKVENTKTRVYNFTSGEPLRIGEGLTGEYYLWVDGVSEKSGNISEEQCIGTFIFDNTEPEVKFRDLSK